MKKKQRSIYFKDAVVFLEWYVEKQITGISFNDALSRYNSSSEFKDRIIELMNIENDKRKKARVKKGSNLGSKFGSIIGKKNVENGLMHKIQKVGASLGGSANTESQKIAREKQNKEKFAPAGCKAAASQKIAIYDEHHQTFYNLMPSNVWFSLSDAQKLADDTFDDSLLVEKFKRKFKVRNHMSKFTNVKYESKKIGNLLYYKKIQ